MYLSIYITQSIHIIDNTLYILHTTYVYSNVHILYILNIWIHMYRVHMYIYIYIYVDIIYIHIYKSHLYYIYMLSVLCIVYYIFYAYIYIKSYTYWYIHVVFNASYIIHNTYKIMGWNRFNVYFRSRMRYKSRYNLLHATALSRMLYTEGPICVIPRETVLSSASLSDLRDAV